MPASRYMFWHRAWGPLLLLLPPLVVALSVYGLRGLLLPSEQIRLLAPEVTIALASGLPRLLVAQSLWGASIAFLLVVGLTASVYAVWLLLSEGRKGRRMLTGLAALILILTIVILSKSDQFDHPVTDMIFARLGDDIRDGWLGLSFPELVARIAAANRVVWFATGILLVAAAAFQADFSGGDRGQAAAAPAQLRRRAERLKILLYFLSALLVSGVVSVHLLLDMPLALVQPEDPGYEALKIYAESVILFIASLLSLLLIAIYLPAACVLHLEAAQLAGNVAADAPDDPTALEAWQSQYGIKETPIAMLGQLLVMMGPLLSSPLLSGLQKAAELVASS